MKLFTLLAIACFFQTVDALHLNPQKVTIYREKFKDVLLIINFNHPHYDNIPFLKELYGKFFSKIIFYGEKDHPQINSFKIDKGFLLGPIIHDALTKYPNYKGYIFLQDDCVLNIWNYLSLDLDKLWLPQATLTPLNWKFMWYQWANMVDAHNPSAWLFWTAPWGYKAMKEGWLQLLPHDRENLDKNAGTNNTPGAQCDMFYIPHQFRQDAIRLNEYFKNALCEYAVPTIMSCLDLQVNWENTTLYWDYHLETQWPLAATVVHPVKFSNHKFRIKTEEIFNAFFA